VGQSVSHEAMRVHSSCVILDTHVDTILCCLDLNQDLSLDSDIGYMDLPSMRAGHLAGAFFACCVEPEHIRLGTAADRLHQLVDAVLDLCRRYPDQIGLACSADDIRRFAAEGRRAVVVSIEGAQGLGDRLEELELLHGKGIRAISLTHFTSNAWADSSTDRPLHNGLSDVGRRAIREMNRLGIMVDVSHISDDAFWQALEESDRPLLASHSSARAIVNHPRNLTDEMIVALARRGGLIGVTWWPEYVSEPFRQRLDLLVPDQSGQSNPAHPQGGDRAGASAIGRLLARIGPDPWKRYRALMDLGIDFPSLSEVVEHIDHMVKVAGVEHVCIGTDHGAVQFEIQGVEKCEKLPVLTEQLLARGYSGSDIRNIYGDNVLRFMDRALS
jgi:membrane dipeptidase